MELFDGNVGKGISHFKWNGCVSHIKHLSVISLVPFTNEQWHFWIGFHSLKAQYIWIALKHQLQFGTQNISLLHVPRTSLSCQLPKILGWKKVAFFEWTSTFLITWNLRWYWHWHLEKDSLPRSHSVRWKSCSQNHLYFKQFPQCFSSYSHVHKRQVSP